MSTESRSPARHYLDHASTSPLRPEAAAAMKDWIDAGVVGDPGRIHIEGTQVRAAIEVAREHVAALFGATGREVVFTSGATESIATATYSAAKKSGRGSKAPTILLSDVEHSAVRLSSARYQTEVISVDRLGRIDVDRLSQSLDRQSPALVHCQWANHEVGTKQPLLDVIEACRDRNVLLHSDAASANGHLPLAFDDCGADFVSVSAHKLGGPSGIGALLVRRGLRIEPLFVGGDQERARRAGMENTLGIIGFGAACAALSTSFDAEATRSRQQTDRIIEAALSVDDVEILGDANDRLPHIVCLSVGGVEAEPILLGLDQAGIAVHSGSACSSESLEPSPVLAAMGVDAERSLRVSVGWSTTDADIDAFCSVFPEVVAKLRSLRN